MRGSPRARVAHERRYAAVAEAHLRRRLTGQALLHREPRHEPRAAALSTLAVAGATAVAARQGARREVPRRRLGGDPRTRADARTRETGAACAGARAEAGAAHVVISAVGRVVRAS